MSKEKKKGGFFKFLAGVGIGAAAGVLFAPKAGSETRKELKEKFDEMKENLKDVDAEDVKEAIEAKIEEIRTSLSELDKETVIKIAKKKAKEIKDMTNELVDYAVKKGTPVLKNAATTARDKAIEVTKEIIEKLEKDND